MTATLVTHHDTIPNFAAAPTVTSVRSGMWSDPTIWDNGRLPGPNDIVLIDGHMIEYDLLEGNVDTIGIQSDGLLEFSSHMSTRLRVVNLMPINYGTLSINTPAEFTTEIIIKDRPIDTAIDPSQYGHGIIVVNGEITMHGAEKTPWVRLGQELQAGDTLIWSTRDDVLLPDTRETRTAPAQWEIVHPGEPCKFPHLGSRNLDGTISDLPHVANLTRNVIVRSENPLGTRGHVFLAGDSTVDIRYVAFKDMGRTKATPLDSTLLDSQGNVFHIGTNQIGRYPLHVHHIEGAFHLEGNVVDSSPKWGIAIHDSHYGTIKHNVVYNSVGAGIICEDGSETGNVFEGNCVMRCDGHPDGTTARESKSGIGVDTGFEGVPYWMRGQRNYWRGNVAVGGRVAGFMIFERAGHVGKSLLRNIPMFEGADVHEPGQFQVFDVRQSVPFAFEDNEAYANGIGFDWWYAWVSIAKNCRAWHNTKTNMFYTYHGTSIVDGFKARGDKHVAEGIVGQHGQYMLASHVDLQGMGMNYKVEQNRKGEMIHGMLLDNFAQLDTPPRPVNLSLQPAPESEVSGVVTLKASISQALTGKVEFDVDGKKLLIDSYAPYEAKWDTRKFANGPHWISAEFGDAVAFQQMRIFVKN